MENDNYLVKEVDTQKKAHVIHINCLKLFRERELDRSLQ